MAKKTSAVTTVEAKKRGVRGFLRVDCGWAREHCHSSPCSRHASPSWYSAVSSAPCRLKLYDKRQDIAKKDQRREAERKFKVSNLY